MQKYLLSLLFGKSRFDKLRTGRYDKLHSTRLMTYGKTGGYLKWASLCFGLFSLVSCQSAYYGTMEKLGYHKRDLLVDRVQDARDSQEEAKKQFESALDQFRSVADFDGGELEKQYDILKAAFDKSKSKAEAVETRINSVEDVAEALFEEWKGELNEYTNVSLRKASANQLKQTEEHYRKLISAMKRAEEKIQPVLSAFKDQVLFLKHNLNAKAIASLQNELVSVESNVASLIKEMETSIAEANAFISAMSQ